VPKRYEAPFDKLSGVRRTYAGMVAAMDEAVGQIVTTLEERGLLENTLIVFSSDNGGPAPGKVTSNGPLRAGKGSVYEGGIRALAFATWPGHIPSGKRNGEPLHIIDWYPTLLKLAGGSLEQKLPLDGRDLWPVLTAGAKSPHDELLLPGMAPNVSAIRRGEWKLIAKGEEAVELYNLSTDLGEEHNVADEHPTVAKELHGRLLDRLKSAVQPLKATKQ
jgi:arylsulfatase A-like enzyme